MRLGRIRGHVAGGAPRRKLFPVLGFGVSGLGLRRKLLPGADFARPGSFGIRHFREAPHLGVALNARALANRIC